MLTTAEVKTAEGMVTIRPESAVWKVFINDEKVLQQDANLKQEESFDWVYKVTGKISLDFMKQVEEKDMIYVMLVITDNYNRTYVADYSACMMEEDETLFPTDIEFDRQDERWLR